MHQIAPRTEVLGISLALIGSADSCIQSHPIASAELSSDTSNSL